MHALLAALAVLSIVWLPFYDNWRFCVGGDSAPWFELALTSAEPGLHRSSLSIRGIGDHFTYTQVIVDNALMFLVEPSFLWHRVSKLVLSLVGLVAIYSYCSSIASLADEGSGRGEFALSNAIQGDASSAARFLFEHEHG